MTSSDWFLFLRIKSDYFRLGTVLYVSVILALRRQKQEDFKFKASLRIMASSRPIWLNVITCGSHLRTGETERRTGMP